MSIHGLTTRTTTKNSRPRVNVLGKLHKGEREEFGKDIKLYDRPYFVFTPDDQRTAEQMSALFVEAYGKDPVEIPDVRIAATLSDNFDIQACAWLTASKHTSAGSSFLAKSDGCNVVQARNPQDGKVYFYEPGEFPHESATKPDGKGRPCFVYGEKRYPWQRTMAVDLVLPTFNKLLYKAGIAGHGVVRFTTTSTYDIPTLIDEYEGMLDEWASLMANPANESEYETARRYMPLRDVPIRLFRSLDKITTPNWKDGGDPGERPHSTRWLCHWQIGSRMAEQMQDAMDIKTTLFLQAVATRPVFQLTGGQKIDRANRDLFGDEPAAEIPATASTANLSAASSMWRDWTEEPEIEGEEIESGDYVEGEFLEENSRPTTATKKVAPIDWRQEVLSATTLDKFSASIFQLHPDHFGTANAAKHFYKEMIGRYDPKNNAEALFEIEAILAEEGDEEEGAAQEPPAEPQRPVAAEKQAKEVKSAGKGKHSWDGVVVPGWRERIASNPKPTVGTVVSAVVLACAYYENENHALNSLDGYNKGDKLTTDDAVALYDQLIERARQKMTAVPA